MPRIDRLQSLAATDVTGNLRVLVIKFLCCGNELFNSFGYADTRFREFLLVVIEELDLGIEGDTDQRAVDGRDLQRVREEVLDVELRVGERGRADVGLDRLVPAGRREGFAVPGGEAHIAVHRLRVRAQFERQLLPELVLRIDLPIHLDAGQFLEFGEVRGDEIGAPIMRIEQKAHAGAGKALPVERGGTGDEGGRRDEHRIGGE